MLDKTDKLYPCVEELRYVVENTSCRNIALTGVYGSGKSSIIETFLKSKPCKNPLKISLSTFFDKTEGHSKPTDKQKYNANIEYKIVQHILYKSDPRKIAHSRFDRINIESSKKLRWESFWTAIAAICILLLVKPVFLHLEGVGNSTAAIIDLVSVVYLCLYFSCLFYKVTGFLYRAKLDSVKAKGFEIGFTNEGSVFNKLLDEIVYYFNTNEYDFVVFEDLDRLYEPQTLFLELRELNMLLNESDTFMKAHRSVKFVYAIRDDVFTGALRTKCFDYIIPVAPIVDQFNASDYLLDHKEELFEEMDDMDIRELGVWITGFREMNNILNEFNLYKQLVMQQRMSERKLLAMIIYKNVYPKDYSALHTKEGFLYMVFKRRDLFTDPLIADNSGKVKSLRADIASYKSKISEIKKQYVDYLVRKYKVDLLYVGEESYTVDDVLELDWLFELLRTNAFTKYYYLDAQNEESGILPYNIDFSDIEEAIGNGESYSEAVYEPISSIRTDEKEIDELNRKIRNKEQESLQDLFSETKGEIVKKMLMSLATIVTDVTEAQVNFVQTMILGGYIQEDYSSYISFYHPGSLKEGDFKFLNSVRQWIQLPFDYPVQDVGLVVEQLRTTHFCNDCILNYDILQYLLTQRAKANLLDLFVKTARMNPEFVVAYSKYADSPRKFLSLVFGGWNNCVLEIMSITDKSLLSDMLRLFFDASPADIKLKNEELDYISNSYAFISQNIDDIDLGRLKGFISHFNVRFKSLVEPVGASQTALFEYVIDSARFIINYDNLRVYLGEDFERKPFTAISQLGSEKFQDYVVERNLAITIDCFPEGSIEEEPEPLAKLMGIRGLDEQWLTDYVAKQKLVFDSLEGIPVKRQHIVMEKDKVKPTWANVLSYFKQHTPQDDVLTDFINRHASDLAEGKCEGDAVLVARLEKSIFCGNALEFNNYLLLLPCFDSELDYADMEADLEENRIQILIDTKKLGYSAESLAYVSESFSEDTLALFFIRFFEEFDSDNEPDWDNYCSNHIGIRILESDLTLDQKKRFIDGYAHLNTRSEDSRRYAGLICIYYVRIGRIDSDTDKEMLLSALDYDNRPDAWRDKISLINMMNGYYPYDKATETRMVSSLGGGYPKLNTPYGRAHFDINDENRSLLNYLKEHRHYVSNIYEKKDQLYVSFLHG